MLRGPLPPCFDPHIHDQSSWPLWMPDRQGVIRNTAMETLPSSRHLPLKDGAPKLASAPLGGGNRAPETQPQPLPHAELSLPTMGMPSRGSPEERRPG